MKTVVLAGYQSSTPQCEWRARGGGEKARTVGIGSKAWASWGDVVSRGQALHKDTSLGDKRVPQILVPLASETTEAKFFTSVTQILLYRHC